MTSERAPLEELLRPVALIDQIILILPSTNPAFGFYQVDNLEPLPPSRTLDLDLATFAGSGGGTSVGPGPIPGATGTPLVAATRSLIQIAGQGQFLEMPPGNIAQLRMYVLDDFELTIFQPRAKGRFVTRLQQAAITPETRLVDTTTISPPDARSEFFIYESQNIFVTLTNVDTLPLVKARVSFYGIRFALHDLKIDPAQPDQYPDKFTRVNLEGF